LARFRNELNHEAVVSASGMKPEEIAFRNACNTDSALSVYAHASGTVREQRTELVSPTGVSPRVIFHENDIPNNGCPKRS